MTAPAERQRRENNKDRILAALKDGAKTNMELLAIGGLRYGGRVHELRAEGWDVRTERPEVGGLCVYRLVGKVLPSAGRLF